jgi:hypothetical protein
MLWSPTHKLGLKSLLAESTFRKSRRLCLCYGTKKIHVKYAIKKRGIE